MGPSFVTVECIYLLLFSDQFSKRHEAVGKPNQEAQTAARALVETCITNFGCPLNFHSDKGTNFMYELFRELCRFLGIKRTSTTFFHLEENTRIEKTNRRSEEMFPKFVNNHQNEWKSYLQQVMMAYRSSIHAVTNLNSFYVVLGTLLRLRLYCVYETLHYEYLSTPKNFIFNMKTGMQSAHHLLRAEMQVQQTRQKTFYEYCARSPT